MFQENGYKISFSFDSMVVQKNALCLKCNEILLKNNVKNKLWVVILCELNMNMKILFLLPINLGLFLE